ncbi:hypothetical protein L1049_004422 [Liquidambar formosana]|uniref:Uncharacterized protein n=1 Tax=Liquidambar formosana TaxID=63359 RepID=A0AAP0RN75_LIQFO
MLRRSNFSSLNGYIRHFKNCCDGLATIGKSIDDKSKVSWLLNGLGAQYEAFTTPMLKLPTPSYVDVVMGLIESQNLNGFIDATWPKPSKTISSPNGTDTSGTKETPNLEYQYWKRSDRLLRGWITRTLTEEVLSLVVGLKTSHEV